jgi:hypothetical protein
VRPAGAAVVDGDRDDVEATGGVRAQEVGRIAHADRLPTAVAQRLDRAAPRRRLNRGGVEPVVRDAHGW